jgi:hypothetical protein
MIRRISILIVLLCTFTTACAAQRSLEQSVAGNAPAAIAPMEMVKSLDVSDRTEGGGETFNVPATQVERLVIKNANLSLYVDDPTTVVAKISQMAEHMGGFVVSSNLYQTRLESGLEVPHASITVRVPAERLNEAMESIKAETKLPVVNETVSSQDVTSEYTDLQSRLHNLEAAEEQLQQIMDAAVKTEDVLNVYSQLTLVREQIEIIKGQMKYYEQSAALSSISVELTATAAQQPLTVGGWQPKGVAKDAIQALIYAMQGLANFVIWFALFILPIGLVVALLFFLLFLVARWLYQRLRRK